MEDVIKKAFLEQTAKDYDMPYAMVKHYYEYYYDIFYEKLEEYIKNRSNNY